MNIEQLVTQVKQDKETGHFTLQAIINRHYRQIEAFKEEGYAYLKMLELFELDIKKSHFQTLLKRARKAAKKKADLNIRNDLSIEESNPNEDTLNSLPLKLSVEEWSKQTMIKMNEHLVRRLEENGFNPEKVKKLGIYSTLKLSNYLTTYQQQSKYK